MATNPMQRKARNSFLLGMLVMLIITGIIIAILFIQLTNIKKAEKQEKLALRSRRIQRGKYGNGHGGY